MTADSRRAGAAAAGRRRAGATYAGARRVTSRLGCSSLPFY